MDTFHTDNWLERLERILASSEGRDAGELVREISTLGAEMGNDAGEALLDAHPELYAYKPALTGAFDQMVVERDAIKARELLEREFDGPVSYLDTADAYSTEIYHRLSGIFDHVDFLDCARAVMVGCGGRPFTICHIHDKTTVPDIVGLDIMPEAIETTNAIAAKLGYGRMRAELCDGRDYDYGETQIVYVAGMVTAKAAVLSRIADTAPENVRIVVREPVSLGLLWSESAERSLDRRLEVFHYGPGSWSLSRDVFFRRRGEPAAQEGAG